jgi:hypothetical protein
MKFFEKKISIDAFISLVIVKKLLLPITKSKAFKLNLVNSSGDIIKTPETPEEKESLTLLDKLIFKLKQLLGSRVANFSKYTYIRTINDLHLYNNISVSRDFTNIGQIQQLKKDMMKVLKENDISLSSFVSFMINDDVDTYLKDSNKNV